MLCPRWSFLKKKSDIGQLGLFFFVIIVGGLLIIIKEVKIFWDDKCL